MSYREGSVVSAMTWMFVLSILLFWLPVVGPFIAGFVGGRKAGTIGNALLAVFLPAVIIGGILFFVGAGLTGVPVIGFLAGMGGLVISLIHVGPLLVGAILGAIL